METHRIDGVKIDGVWVHVPDKSIANEEKIAKATGINNRRVASENETVVDLCVKAAEQAVDKIGREQFGAVICVSFTQHDRMPCAAVQAQARLGLPKNIIAFDVTLACSGWGYGLYLAGLLARQTNKKVLLLDGDVQSEFMNSQDAATSPLLADCGTATIVSADPSVSEAWEFGFIADGAQGAALKLSHGGTITMDGFGVFRFVATDVVGYIKDFMTSIGRKVEDYDKFVPHQPNVYMVKQLAKSVGFDEMQTVVTCDKIGNVSSASIPAGIALGKVRGKVLFAGFGGGLSVSIGSIKIGE